MDYFLKLGLTDAGLFIPEIKNLVFLTDYYPLFGILEKKGRNVHNFNHLRSHLLND